ncbi:hypothetical protein HK102_012213, partial [Quaeritorhiza haematococci]
MCGGLEPFVVERLRGGLAAEEARWDEFGRLKQKEEWATMGAAGRGVGEDEDMMVDPWTLRPMRVELSKGIFTSYQYTEDGLAAMGKGFALWPHLHTWIIDQEYWADVAADFDGIGQTGDRAMIEKLWTQALMVCPATTVDLRLRDPGLLRVFGEMLPVYLKHVRKLRLESSKAVAFNTLDAM